MSNDTYYLIEDFPVGFDPPQGKILSLSPEACYELRKRGVSYSIPENFYYEGDLFHWADRTLPDLMAWFDRFEHYLADHVPWCGEKDIKLIYYLRYRLKYLIDSVSSLAYIFNSFFQKAKLTKLVYLRKPGGDSPLDFSLANLYDNKRRFLKPVVRSLCQLHAIDFVDLFDSQGALSPRCDAGDSPLSFSQAPRVPLSKKWLKGAYNFLRYQKWKQAFPSQKPFSELSILFTTAGHKDCDPVLKEFLDGGARVFLRTGGQISEVSAWKQAFVNLSRDESWEKDLAENFRKAAVRIESHSPLLDNLDAICGFRARGIFLPYLQYFIRKHCLEVALRVPPLIKFMSDYHIDFVIGNNATNFSEAPVMIAAEKAGATKRVCLQHGGGALAFEMWKLSQAAYFDIFFATDPDSREYSEKEFQHLGGHSCAVYEYASFLKPVASYRYRDKIRKKKQILYVPTRGPLGIRLLNAPCVPITLYYHLQIAILDFLSRQRDITVIFKYAPANDWLSGSTLSYLRDKNYSNIRIASEPFWKCLHLADRVLLDYPGTALFEAAVTPIPVLALYYDFYKIRESAFRYFRKSLQSFRSEQEACHHIDIFLKANPDDYRVRLPLTHEKPSEVLNRLSRFHRNESGSLISPLAPLGTP